MKLNVNKNSKPIQHSIEGIKRHPSSYCKTISIRVIYTGIIISTRENKLIMFTHYLDDLCIDEGVDQRTVSLRLTVLIFTRCRLDRLAGAWAFCASAKVTIESHGS